MSKSDDRRMKILDDRFDEILAQTKPLLLKLRVKSNARICQSWIERLNRADDQPGFRNDYLLEMYRQLKDGCLSAPFDKPPDTGRLKPLSRLPHTHMTSSSCNELTETSQSVCDQSRGWPKPRSKSLHRNDVPRSKTFPKYADEQSTSPYDDTPSSPTIRYHEQNDERYEKSLLKTYKNRIETLSTIVEELEIQNEKLQQKIKYFQNVSMSDKVPQLHTRIKHLMSEITNLKNKLTEVQELKLELEKHHKEIVEQYKIKMTEQFKNMKHQLENARHENEDLNNKVLMIDQKMQELNNKKEDSIKSNEDMWIQKLELTKLEYEKKLEEKDLLIQSRDELVYQKEVELTQKLDEIDSLCEKIKDLQYLVETRNLEDAKLHNILVEQHEKIMEEFGKIRNNIENASRQQTECHQHEILLLKKNVQKFEKFANKLKEEYEKQIYHIIKSQSREIINLQMQLQNTNNSALMKTLPEKCSENFKFVEKNYKKSLDSFKSTPDDESYKYSMMVSNLENTNNELQNR